MYETLVHGSSATRVTLEPETIFVSHIEGPGGGGHSPIKVTGVLVEKFREHPQKVPESCFMDMSQIHFHPPPPLPARYQFNNNKLYNWHCKF